MASDLKVTTDPAEVGIDAARLERLDRRLARWVDDGQLPGFLVTVARRGQPGARRAVRPPGRRERPAGRGRHPLAHLLDDQAGHLGRGDDAVRGGRLRAQRPDREVAARVRRDPRLRRRVGAEAGDRAADRADPRAAPAHPHVGADLRLPPRPPRRRDVPRRWATSGAPRPAPTRAEVLPRSGRRSRWSSSPAASGTTASPPTSSAGWSRCSPGSRWTSSSSSGSSRRSACGTRRSACARTTTPSRWPGSTRADAGAARRAADRVRVPSTRSTPPPTQAGVPVRRRRAGVHRR